MGKRRYTRRMKGGMPEKQTCESCDKKFGRLYDYQGEQLCKWCRDTVVARIKKAKELVEVRSDIQLFKTAGSDRGSNDELNNRRERVLVYLYNPPTEFLNDPYWVEMSMKWKALLKELCAENYDAVTFKRMGGRSYNYDLEITFLLAGEPVKVAKAEFKHNAKTIDGLPEYFSPATDKPYFPVSYGDFFHDRYLDKICAISDKVQSLRPTKDVYIKKLYQPTYSADPFFKCLYEGDSDMKSEHYKRKQAITHESIATYLTENASSMDVKLLSQDIRKRQTGKVFILWDLKNFQIDTIKEDEMEIVGVAGIKNKNTIVAMSKAGTKHNMLLRWKNHLGVLYPAWQISLAR